MGLLCPKRHSPHRRRRRRTEALAHLKLSELRQRLAAAGGDGTAVDEALDEAAETGSNPKQALVALLQTRSPSGVRRGSRALNLNSPVARVAKRRAAFYPGSVFRPQRLRDPQDARRGGRTVKAALRCSLPAACTLAAVGMALAPCSARGALFLLWGTNPTQRGRGKIAVGRRARG